MVKIYKQPFAHNGDTIAIPDASQPDGKMSSADGWTPDYQLPKTDPNYKPVGRQEMNGVFKEVTEALGEVQVQGAASWSADGAPYPINAQVYHNGKQWLALRANSVEPAEGEDWTGFSAEKYDVGEFYYFRHPTIKPGFAAAQGGLISGAYQGKNITEYPIWAYLQTAEGQLLLKTEAEWQAMTTATWATLADGSTVGWNGIGGAPYYVQDLGAGTLRMPDLRGMYAEAAGFNSLGVGDVQGDVIRDIPGSFCSADEGDAGTERSGPNNVSGAFTMQFGNGTYVSDASLYADRYRIALMPSRVVPTGAANAPRRWGALACCYLGRPA